MTTITGYNASPPSDDGSQTEANKVKWSTITGKIGDPLNDFLAAFHEDQTGSLNSTGSADAYLLTSNVGYTAIADIPLISFKANFLNTGAATIDIDGLGAKTIKKNHDRDLDADDIEVGQIVVLSYNVTDDTFEMVSNTAGSSAGATGGGADLVFFENDQVVTTDYTITDGKNAGSFGAITINSGVTVTIGAGEVWTII
jgi:hypothetical protein